MDQNTLLAYSFLEKVVLWDRLVTSDQWPPTSLWMVWNRFRTHSQQNHKNREKIHNKILTCIKNLVWEVLLEIWGKVPEKHSHYAEPRPARIPFKHVLSNFLTVFMCRWLVSTSRKARKPTARKWRKGPA